MSEEPFTGDTAFQMPRAEVTGCALVQDLIPLYIDGEVSPASHALIADHLERCEHCSGFLAGARSVRTQILDEERKVRVAFSTKATVAEVQQPVWSSPLATLWRFVMLLLWLGSLALTFIGVVEGHPEGLVLGGFGTLAAIGGLLLGGGSQRAEWRIGMLLTGLLGLFCAAAGMLGIAGMAGPVFVGGLMQLAIAAWGLWPRQPRTLATPVGERSSPSSAQPLLTALLSLAGIALSLGLILGGGLLSVRSSQAVAVPAPMAGAAVMAGDEKVIITAEGMKAALHAKPAAPVPADAAAVPAAPDVVTAAAAPVVVQPVELMYAGPDWESLIFGVLVTAAGLAGVLIIAGRRGWLPRELRNLTPRQWVGYALAGGGLVWLSVALRTLIVGFLPSLPAVGVSAALVLLGWALARRSPPDEPRSA